MIEIRIAKRVVVTDSIAAPRPWCFELLQCGSLIGRCMEYMEELPNLKEAPYLYPCRIQIFMPPSRKWPNYSNWKLIKHQYHMVKQNAWKSLLWVKNVWNFICTFPLFVNVTRTILFVLAELSARQICPSGCDVNFIAIWPAGKDASHAFLGNAKRRAWHPCWSASYPGLFKTKNYSGCQ